MIKSFKMFFFMSLTFTFSYQNISKNLSAKYYQINKEQLQK